MDESHFQANIFFNQWNNCSHLPQFLNARGCESMKNGEILVKINTIIHSKYFALSDWLQSPVLFFITNWRLQYLEDADWIG